MKTLKNSIENKSFFKAVIAVVVLTLVSTSFVEAKSWRVNNDKTKMANFVDINAAMESEEVMAGDTLYLDPGSVCASDQNVTKSVTIIGTGYFLNNDMVPASITALLRISAEQVKVIGVIVKGETRICSDYVTLERCCLINIFGEGTRYNFKVLQCIASLFLNSTHCLISGTFRNSAIENCILMRDSYWGGGVMAISGFSESLIKNNYLLVRGSAVSSLMGNCTSCSIYNNIMINDRHYDSIISNSSSGDNNTFHHNVISAQEGTYANFPDNVYLGTADTSVLFETEKANDAAYRLSANSPAKGVAFDGGDCGPYGGDTPYVESGLPMYHPYITKAIVASKPVDGKVKVTLNVKMQNE